MLKLKQGVALVAVGSLAFVAGRAIPTSGGAIAAQPTKEKPATGQPAKDKAPTGAQPEMAMPKPGPEHRNLDVFVGEWQGGGKMWMQPGSEPMEFSGKAVRKWDMDGWFIIENVTGDPQAAGQPGFKGLFFLADRQTGESLGITLWETDEQAAVMDQGVLLRAREEAIRSLGTEAVPMSTTYEVVAQA